MSIAQPYLPSPFIHTAVKRRKNTWYTIASGNWSDPNIWMSNSHRKQTYAGAVVNVGTNAGSIALYPSFSDDVYINHSVVLDVSNNASALFIEMNNLYVSGSLSMNSTSARAIAVGGDMQVAGTLDLSGNSHQVYLFGANNRVSNFISGTASMISYWRMGDQNIMDLSYRNLDVRNGNGTGSQMPVGVKYLTNNLSISGNLSMVNNGSGKTTLECLNYNLTVAGTTSVNGGVISKTGSGSLLFIGAYSQSGNLLHGFDLTGNPTVEFRGGISTAGGSNVWNTGTSLWSFTTNTQTITLGSSGTLTWDAPISIVGAIAVSEAGTGIMSLNQPIDCTSSSGSVVAKGTIYFNSTSSLPSFTTGTFDRTTNANTVGYTMGASITLPYTSYSSLYISNSGTKTSLGNTTLSGNLLINQTFGNSPVYELSTFDLTVTGTTSIAGTSGGTTGKLSKTGAGNVTFIGNVGWVNSTASLAQIDFSGGNPSVELRGGMTQTNGANDVVKTGTGTWTFSTNSQSLTAIGSAGYIVFNSNVLISGAINVTVSKGGNTDWIAYVNTVTGNNAASTFTIGVSGFVYLLTTTLPMATGVFSYNSVSTATLGFAFSGNYTLPYTSFAGLAIGSFASATTGVKTLAGNTTLTGNLLIQQGGNIVGGTNTLEISTFDLTVAGNTSVGYKLSKTGAGNVTFIGLLTLAANTQPLIEFGGNPSVELRGGIALSAATGASFNTGSGTWSFTTNNQSITGSTATFSFVSPFLISGAITLTNSLTSSTLTLTSTLNGNNAASTFDNRGTVNYQATQQPMLTGVLQTNLAANTFIYNAAGNQDVKGGTYRTLTLAGSGVKTLQGNVVVATAYTLTPPATLNLNGFTRS